ncbi:MAG: NADPH-dependent ferric siderophore reductase [Ramlibacter sp.]|nr:NADPH-dependent ferric siderophore reductase [Ramlibacter sp.]
MSTISTGTRVQRVRHETRRREVEVVRVEDLGPHFRSVTFGGESLAGFTSLSFDDHVKFILPGNDAGPVMRDYTPRRYDADKRELTIEFALHGDGPAADWAARATVGQRATIGGPRGSFIIPTDYEWHLFVGDETALPAIARRLEELPAGARAIVVGQVDDAGDRRVFESSVNLTLKWLGSTEELVEAVRLLELPAGEGYAWCAGEARVMATVRRMLVEEKGHDRHAIRAAAYWKQGATAHHENLESD